jgi:SAM-dependent methyltransferase
MARDLYSRPPRPAESSAITRRALLRLGSPGVRDREGTAAVREAVTAAASRPGSGELRRAVEPVANVLSLVAGVEAGHRVLEVGSLAELGQAAGTFDRVLSAFGLAQDPEPDRVVGELARVAAPGGVVALTAWVPRGLPGRLTEFAEQIVPLPLGVPSPSEWGRAGVGAARLGRRFADVEVRTRIVRLAFADEDSAFGAISASVPFPPERTDELRPAFDRLLASCNDALEGVEIPGRYLLVRGTVTE